MVRLLAVKARSPGFNSLVVTLNLPPGLLITSVHVDGVKDLCRSMYNLSATNTVYLYTHDRHQI